MDAFATILAFAFLVIQTTSVLGDKCPSWYVRYNKQHSYCKPDNRKCQILSNYISNDDMEIILMEHNYYRSKVAKGDAPKLPGASNMLQLEWDDELAYIAQKHAEQCDFDHDCSDCRRVKNFGVGQNIAMERVRKSLNPPLADWFAAIKSWWKEKDYFDKSYIAPFVKPRGNPTYGHFTQLIWGETWKVGCGFAMFEDKEFYNKFYVCNYGPEGNLLPKNVFEIGSACAKCPDNTCCDGTCDKPDYDGLCKLSGGKKPVYKPPENYFFYCNFEGQADCKTKIKGVNKWKMYNAHSGKFLGIILNGGETSTMVFPNHIKPSASQFCFGMSYRKAANRDGDEDALECFEKFFIIPENQSVDQPLKNYLGVGKHRFNKFGVSFDWQLETEVSLVISVPDGKPQQYFELQEIYGYDGPCSEDN